MPKGKNTSITKSETAKASEPGVVVALPENYGSVLEEMKGRIRTAQTKAVLAVNAALITVYLDIGRFLADEQGGAAWGDQVVERLASDLRAAFPAIRGFSRTNLYSMRQIYLGWAEAIQNDQFVPQLVGQIPWGHHRVLIARVKDPAERLWYAQATLEHGWSRAVLTLQIETGLYRRQGQAVTNFARTLPPPQSDLAQRTLKDPYVFDFLTLTQDANEREVEQGLVDHVQKFLLELGAGFAFVGRQVPIEVGANTFHVDLLFYQLRLRSFFVVDLKAVPFRPEFAGKMNFYLSAIDETLKHPDDKPTIGLLLCKGKDHLTVEYALRDINKPIGVAGWETQLVASLPTELCGSLPTVEELERELGLTSIE